MNLESVIHSTYLDDETGEVLGEERLFKGDYGRIRDVRVAPDGSVLMVTDEDNGSILRLSRAAAD